MTEFSPRIREYWRSQVAGDARGSETFAVTPSLSRQRPAMILTRDDGSSQMAVRPELAALLDQVAPTSLSIEDRKAALIGAGIAFHDPDHLFYLPEGEPLPSPAGSSGRRLTQHDRGAFDIFHNEAPEADREDAFVEWDHWAVFGCFDGDRLISAASAIL